MFHLWTIETKGEVEPEEKGEKKNVEEVVKAGFTVLIANLPSTVDPSYSVPFTPLQMNGDKNYWSFNEMILKSQFESSMGISEGSPFTQVKPRNRWGCLHLHLYSKDPVRM